MKSRQAGISLIGFLIVLLVIGFFGFMVMKLFPAYSEAMGVSKALSQEASDGVDGKSLAEIRNQMSIKFDNQYVDEKNVPLSAITLQKGASGMELHVDYDRDIPFIYNIDFLVHFNKSVPVSGTPATE